MNNCDKKYLELVDDILTNGVRKDDRTGTGTYSVFGRQLRFNMQEGFPLMTTKKVHYKSVLAELLWFLEGGDNIRSLLQKGCTIWSEWPYARYCKINLVDAEEQKEFTIKEFEKVILADEEFAKRWGGLGPVYGSQWVNWNGEGVNQMKQAIDDLLSNPDSRRIMVTAWNPSQLKNQLLPPCHYTFQFWTRLLTDKERQNIYLHRPVKTWTEQECADMALGPDDKFVGDGHAILDRFAVPRRGLSLLFHMRSVDTFLGMPFDIASFATLLHMVAQVVNMRPDELIMETGDTHIYTNHVEQMRLQMTREPMRLPTIRLDDSVKNIFDFTMDSVTIVDYNSHASIKGDIAV